MSMNSLIKQLLTNINGRYSRKSFITILFTFFSLGIGIYAAIVKDPIDVFNSSLVFLGLLVGITVADKKITSKEKI